MLLLVTVISIGAWAEITHDPYNLSEAIIVCNEGNMSQLVKGNNVYQIHYTVYWDGNELVEGTKTSDEADYYLDITYSDDTPEPVINHTEHTLTINMNNFAYSLANYTLKIIATEHNTGEKDIDFCVVRFEGNSPFVVSDSQDGPNLKLLADCVNNGITFKDEYFKLGKDITYDTSNPNNYTPIGGYYSNVKNFLGHFDGDGHTIKGVRISYDYPSDVGLFGRLGNGAEVKNLTLDDAIIYGPEKTGGIVGTNSGGTITNCHVTSSVFIHPDNSTSTPSKNYHGGIVGANQNNGFVSYCTSAATLSNETESWNFYGGIVGQNKSGSTLDHNLVIGAIIPYADGKHYGAIVGQNESSGSLDHNYYADCTKKDNKDIGGCNGADVTNQAEPATILTDTKGLSLPTSLKDKVVYFRAFRYGEPSTIILPFVPNRTENVDKFYTFKGVEKDGNYYKAIMEESTSLNYNTPYIYKAVKPNNETESFRLAFYVNNFESSTSIGEVGSTTPTEHWTFKGSYSEILWGELSSGQKRNVYGFAGQAVSDTKDSSKSIEAGEFVRIGEYVRLRPQRCYMEYTPTSSTRAGSLTDEELPETIRVILVDDGGKTDIGSLSPKTGIITFDSDAWYSLDGKRFSTQPAQKGIYVNNGKKVVIK